MPRAAAHDFTFVVLPDTKNYAGGEFGGTPEYFYAQTQGIAANRDSPNIVYVPHVGDCVRRGDKGGDATEWVVADSAIRIPEDLAVNDLSKGVPYGIAVGNHDQSPNGVHNVTTSRIIVFSERAGFSGRSCYGGNDDNHFDLFSTGGLDYIIVYFKFDTYATAAVLQWEDSLLSAHSNRRPVFVSHFVVIPGCRAPWSVQGQAIYAALTHHPILFLLLWGHIAQPENRRTAVYNGNTIYTPESNYQWRANGPMAGCGFYSFPRRTRRFAFEPTFPYSILSKSMPRASSLYLTT